MKFHEISTVEISVTDFRVAIQSIRIEVIISELFASTSDGKKQFV